MIFNKPYIPFSNEEERDHFLKKYKLLSQNPREEKIFYYKGRDVISPVPCSILGYEREYEASATLVIEYGLGTCFIHSDFLKQMQSKSFLLDDFEEKMVEQNSKSNNSLFYQNVQNIIDDVISSHDLPQNSIHLYSNISSSGEKAGTEISKSICIFEPEYPPRRKTNETLGKNFVIMKMQIQRDSQIVLFIRNSQLANIDLPQTASIKALKSNKDFQHVIFQADDKSIYPFIFHNITYCLANYEASSSFGCCSRFVECSDAKKCVHENKIYSMGCMYRKNLDAGKIFYGKNKNVFKYEYTAIDFETANNNMYSACSVGLVAVSDLKIVKTDYFLIKPPTDHFRHEHVDVHGLTFDDVKASPSFDTVYQSIHDYITNSKYIIAHNAQFDMSVLYECLKFNDMPAPEFMYIDSANLTAQVRCDCGNSLSDCANFFNVDLSEHHNALKDAEACALIVIEAIKKSGLHSLDDFVAYYPKVKTRLFSELKSTGTMRKSTHFNRVKPSDVVAATSTFDENHVLYGKNCVFTGELQTIDRKDAMQKVVDAGGVVKSSVSTKTNYLIVGKQDKKIVGEDGLSTKEEKAYALIAKGIDIKILNEEQFLSIFK